MNMLNILGSHLLDQRDINASRSSLDSHDIEPGNFDRISRGVANIVKGVSHNPSEQSVVDAVESTDIIDVQNESEENDVKENSELNVNLKKPESPSEYSRLLSRSESAGDANIIDKLQQTSKKMCSRVLQFNGGVSNEDMKKSSPTK